MSIDKLIDIGVTHRTYKYRIKDKRAAKRLQEHARAVNQCWNWCAAQHRDRLNRYRLGEASRLWLTHFELAQTFNGFGKEIGLSQKTIGEVCAQWVRNRSIKFRSSFGAKRAAGWIPFHKQSRRVDGNSVIYLGQRYRFFGNKRRPLPADAKSGHFTEDTLGRWWVCFRVEVVSVHAAYDGEVGIDLGLKNFATLSTGDSVEAPQFYRNHEARLAIAQRAGNSRRAKVLHAMVANRRRDFHHKLSRRLADEHAFIVVGNVNAESLARTRMAKSVTDAGWSAFRDMLRYKARHFVEVDESFTTQTCSSCGALPPERPRGIAGLRIREWECSSCGAAHDRDVNAALNILALGRSAAPLVEESREGARLGQHRIGTRDTSAESRAARSLSQDGEGK